ncbi:Glycerophosphocholine phosphodiesterase GPCPD1 [Thelohanellus kitauei]|uniref:Glycerophosphocholine phosphodiesterase GPCPD1 n=1 Tax=Thelohanellus kitauei TaxID=669202 RepID=A0A0C2IRA1_THEKT|nr:Glycerophosphocholine phosphodiesterase GPCPD1 [Thelohanellus kitauei]
MNSEFQSISFYDVGRFVYIQFLFHSARGCPLSLHSSYSDLDIEQFSLSMFVVATNKQGKKPRFNNKPPVKAYRLLAEDQYIHNTNYDIADEDAENFELEIINADDIQAFPGGISYSPQYIVCFSLNVSDLRELYFKIRVTLYSKSTNPLSGKPFICESFHTGLQIQNNSTGSIIGVLLTDNQEIAGNINFDYLITYPWSKYPEYVQLPIIDLRMNKKPLMIGHRGSGCSYGTNPSKYMENTIDSFVVAGQSGADFIELDVQLTRDEAVVVFHDFLTEAVLDLNLAKTDDRSRLEIPLRDLSYYQLKKNKFKHASLARHSDIEPRDTFSDNSIEQVEKIFPLLSEVMQNLPASTGIDIEVKFPQQENNGTWELEGSYFDRNTVVERVLEEVFENNKEIKRPIIFSSFDPGICIMLRQKQKNYPVFFIMTGIADRTKYMDIRSHHIRTAITFCLAEKLSGLCAEIDPISDELQKVSRMVHSQNLYLITWGTGNNSKEIIEKQKKSYVDGIIFDRIYDFIQTPDTNTS